jgi:hypothetical protein
VLYVGNTVAASYPSNVLIAQMLMLLLLCQRRLQFTRAVPTRLRHSPEGQDAVAVDDG